MTCVWTPDPACLADDWAEIDPAIRDRALRLATSSLQMLTLNRVGTCPVTIRPCPEKRQCNHVWDPHRFDDGMWLNACGCRTARWCKPVSEIDIPGPVHDLVLRIDGQEVDLTDGNWRLDDGHLLVWQGETPSPIPATQDIDRPDTQPGTYSLTYSRSYPVSEEGRMAVAYLAMEFVKACQPKGKCSLPKGVTNVVRNGVTFTVQAGLFPNGLTGNEIVDAYILKWVPAGSPQRSATVFNPSKYAQRVRRTSAVPAKATP